MKNPFSLDHPILELRNEGRVQHWTLRDAVEGTCLFGGIGSGKTSGSGRMLARKFLEAGMGGLVLTVKPDEKDLWVQYAKEMGRANDLVVLEPGGKHHFDFLSYESANKDGALSITGNIVNVLKTVIKASEEQDQHRHEDEFWDTALNLLLHNTIDLLLLAYSKVTISELYDVVQNLPKAVEEKPQEGASEQSKTGAFYTAYEAARKRVMVLVNAFKAKQDPKKLKEMSPAQYQTLLSNGVPEARRMSFIDQFFLETFRKLSSKTRSIIDFTFIGFLFQLLQDPIYNLFCQHASTFLPEDCYLHGKIIIISLPVKLFDKAGRDAQIMFKYIWQRAMERRNTAKNARAVFLYADEAQFFLHGHDATFQATARSSRIATVYITQNIHSFFSAMGGTNAEHRVKSFLGTLATKVFHANADIETNVYASKIVGQAFQKDVTVSRTMVGNEFQASESSHWILMDMIRPEDFVGMKTGGPENRKMVEAVMHFQGKKFAGGHHHLKVSFKQA